MRIHKRLPVVQYIRKDFRVAEDLELLEGTEYMKVSGESSLEIKITRKEELINLNKMDLIRVQNKSLTNSIGLDGWYFVSSWSVEFHKDSYEYNIYCENLLILLRSHIIKNSYTLKAGTEFNKAIGMLMGFIDEDSYPSSTESTKWYAGRYSILFEDISGKYGTATFKTKFDINVEGKTAYDILFEILKASDIVLSEIRCSFPVRAIPLVEQKLEIFLIFSRFDYRENAYIGRLSYSREVEELTFEVSDTPIQNYVTFLEINYTGKQKEVPYYVEDSRDIFGTWRSTEKIEEPEKPKDGITENYEKSLMDYYTKKAEARKKLYDTAYPKKSMHIKVANTDKFAHIPLGTQLAIYFPYESDFLINATERVSFEAMVEELSMDLTTGMVEMKIGREPTVIIT